MLIAACIDIIITAITGMLLSQQVAVSLASPTLQKTFALLLIAVALMMLIF